MTNREGIREFLEPRHSAQQCLEEGMRAEAAREAAVKNSKIPEGAAFAGIAKEKVQCVETAGQELMKLQAQLAAGRAAVVSGDQRFRDEYERGLRSLFISLQQFAQRLDTIQYEPFVAEMRKFRGDLGRFKNRYIRLVNEPATSQTQKFAVLVFQACDALIASSDAWRREVEATTRAQSSAKHEREMAGGERAWQWQTVQQLIQRAAPLAPSR